MSSCFLFSKIDTRVHDEPPGAGRRGDAAERVVAVDIGNRVPEVRVIQDVDGVDPEFELPVLMDLEPFDQVHVEAEVSGSSYGRQTECSNFSRLRIH